MKGVGVSSKGVVYIINDFCMLPRGGKKWEVLAKDEKNIIFVQKCPLFENSTLEDERCMECVLKLRQKFVVDDVHNVEFGETIRA